MQEPISYRSFTDSGHPELVMPKIYHERHYTKVSDKDGKICSADYPINSVGYIDEHRIRAVAPTEGSLRTCLPFWEQSWKDKPDKDSFTAVRRSGAIKMTPWSAGYETVSKYIVELNPITTDVVIGSEYTITQNTLNSDCRMTQVSPTEYRWNVKQVAQKRVTRTSIDYIHQDFPKIPFYPLVSDGDRDSLANAAKASVVSDLSSGYDLLTEIGEFSETANYITSLLKSAERPTKLFRHFVKTKNWKQGTAMSKDVANAWMQYRYAIMPIYYSIMDAIETFEQSRSLYKTSRRKERINYTSDGIRDMTRPHMFESGSRKVLISAMGKTRFSSQAQRLASQIKFNPLTTAWELTKFSWVIDWFVNVGDWLNAKSQAYSITSGDSKYCISFTEEYSVATWLYIPPYPSDAPIKRSIKGSRAYGASATPISYSVSLNDPGGLHLLQIANGRTYNRNLFDPGEIYLDINPNLNWKRSLDAISLAVNRTSFRKFR